MFGLKHERYECLMEHLGEHSDFIKHMALMIGKLNSRIEDLERKVEYLEREIHG